MAASILHFLFPPRCVSCKGKRDADVPLCTLCQGEYLREKQMSCRRCGQPMTRCQCRPRYDHHGVLCYLSVFRYKKTGCGGRMILAIKDRKDRRILDCWQRIWPRPLRRAVFRMGRLS